MHAEQVTAPDGRIIVISRVSNSFRPQVSSSVRPLKATNAKTEDEGSWRLPVVRHGSTREGANSPDFSWEAGWPPASKGRTTCSRSTGGNGTDRSARSASRRDFQRG